VCISGDTTYFAFLAETQTLSVALLMQSHLYLSCLGNIIG